MVILKEAIQLFFRYDFERELVYGPDSYNA